MSQSISYFVSGHTAEGYVNYLLENLQDIEQIIILEYHDDRELKPLFMQLKELYEEKGYMTEVISGLMSRDTIAGMIIRERQLAVLSQSIVKETIPGATRVNLAEYSNSEKEKSFDEESENIQIGEAYRYFKEGLQIHDQLEKVYINEMSFEKADKVAENFIAQLLRGLKVKDRTPTVFERLFLTNTPEGKVNYAKELVEPLENVFYIKGRAGTGKSVFMKKVLHACLEYGLDVEMYRCSFDPESVDMIIVRELEFCIFDSTPPHELSPENGKGIIIDLYEETVTPGTDQRYANEINALTTDYQSRMKNGMKALQELNNIYGSPKMNLQTNLALQALKNVIH